MHEWELVGTHVSDTDDFELVEIDAAMTDTISRRRQLEDAKTLPACDQDSYLQREEDCAGRVQDQRRLVHRSAEGPLIFNDTKAHAPQPPLMDLPTQLNQVEDDWQAAAKGDDTDIAMASAIQASIKTVPCQAPSPPLDTVVPKSQSLMFRACDVLGRAKGLTGAMIARRQRRVQLLGGAAIPTAVMAAIGLITGLIGLRHVINGAGPAPTSKANAINQYSFRI